MTVTLPEAVRRAPIAWTRTYCLRHCEGYHVHGPEGAMGYVDEVLLSPADEVVGLVVRGAGKVTVPAWLIDGIDPEAEHLWIRRVPR